MTPEQVIRHNHNGGCPGGGVRVVLGELPGEDELTAVGTANSKITLKDNVSSPYWPE